MNDCQFITELCQFISLLVENIFLKTYYHKQGNSQNYCIIRSNFSHFDLNEFFFAFSSLLFQKLVKCCFPPNLNCLLKDDWLRKIIQNYEDLVLLSSYKNVNQLDGFEGGIERLLCHLTGDMLEESYNRFEPSFRL